MAMWISPNYRDTDFQSPVSLDEKIDVFVDRVCGWQLEVANECINGEKDEFRQSGFAVLSIALSYFKMIAQYQSGRRSNRESGKYFKSGVRLVFPDVSRMPQAEVDEMLDILYAGARCGLYHNGMTDPRIILSGDFKEPLTFDFPGKRLGINPHLLVPILIEHLKEYEKQLRDPGNAEMRSNFERRFSL